MTGQSSATGETGESGSGLFVVGGVVKSIVSSTDRQIVQDYLSSLLQVQNLVVLIGSGASMHLGSPAVRNLSNVKVGELILASGGDVTATDGALLALLNPLDQGDLEKLLNGLQLAESFADQAGLELVTFGAVGEARSFPTSDIQSLRAKINSALAFACKLPGPDSTLEDPLEAHRRFLSRLVRSRRSNLPRPKVFTTNYDLVVEKSLDELGFPYIDGFSGTVNRKLNLAYYGLDFHRVETTSQQVVARADNAIYFHKIHGSLNWRSRVAQDVATGIETLEVYQVDEASTTKGSVLIYPTTAKEGDTLSYPYSDLMRLLGEAVQQSDTAIITLGYGYWDAHINRILLGALGMNPGINVLVTDPFAVMDADTVRVATERPDIVGMRLAEAGLSLKATPVASLAVGSDSRIAVLTGRAGEFTEVAKLMPDPSIGSSMSTPAGIVQLIESLGLEPKLSGAPGAIPETERV